MDPTLLLASILLFSLALSTAVSAVQQKAVEIELDATNNIGILHIRPPDSANGQVNIEGFTELSQTKAQLSSGLSTISALSLTVASLPSTLSAAQSTAASLVSSLPTTSQLIGTANGDLIETGLIEASLTTEVLSASKEFSILSARLLELEYTRGLKTRPLKPGNYIFVAGGTGETKVEAFSTLNSAWSSTSLKVLPKALGSGSAVAVFSSNLFFAGGVQGGVPSDKLQRYTFLTDTWSNSSSSMVFTRYDVSGVILSDQITFLVIGGRKSATEVLNTCEKIDLQAIVSGSSPSWQSAPSLNVSRYAHATFLSVEGNVIVLGGIGSTGALLDSIEVFHRTKQTWELVPTTLRVPRAYFGAAKYGLTGFIAGGLVSITGGTMITNTAEYFDNPSQSWVSVPPLAQARKEGAMVVLQGKMVVVGGTGNSSNVLNTVEIYDPDARSWSTLPHMLTTHTYAIVAAF